MKLREFRLQNNMKQVEVANEIGCSNVVYSRYENEERQPDIQTLWSLADLYHVTIDDIVGRSH